MGSRRPLKRPHPSPTHTFAGDHIVKSKAPEQVKKPGLEEGVTISATIGKHLAFAPVAFAVTEGPAHEVVYANAIFRHLQTTGAIHLGASQTATSTTVADLTPLLDSVYGDAKTVRDAIVPTSADDPAIWSCTVWPVPGTNPTDQKLVVEIRDVQLVESAMARQREVAERLVLSALREQDSARDAEVEESRALYLSKASRDLSTSLDELATRDTVRRLTLPRPGTWCIVDVLESNGSICRLGVVHPDPSKQELARKLETQVAGELKDGQATAAMLSRPGPSVISHEAPGAELMLAARGEKNLAILREIGFAGLLVVPLVVRARVQGAITFVSAPGDDAFTGAETVLALDVASRCALALDNARLYREADRLRRAAEAANQSKSQFLGGMSHELRTPLNAIGGFAELMELGIEGPVTEKQHHALARIKANQQHLLMLINEILNFVRIESGRMEYKFVDVPMATALTDLSAMLAPLLADREMTVDLSGVDLAAIAWADADRVRQILVNVLTNAVKYAGAKNGIIRLSCAVTDGFVTASVSDAGPGIEEKRRESIFEPFVQLESGLTDRRGGVGLGLAISRDLAHAMGGNLTVESTVGAGSTFTLSLPSARPA